MEVLDLSLEAGVDFSDKVQVMEVEKVQVQMQIAEQAVVEVSVQPVQMGVVPLLLVLVVQLLEALS